MEEHKDPTRLEHVQKKLREGIILDRWIAYWHFRNYKIGFTYGSFDPLNPRCVEFLYQAVESLKTLVVGLYSDAMIRKLTGKEPVMKQEDRALMLGGLECVDAVVILDEEDPKALIERVRPCRIAVKDDAQAAAVDSFKAEGVEIWRPDSQAE